MVWNENLGVGLKQVHTIVKQTQTDPYFTPTYFTWTRQKFYTFRWFCATICDEFDGLLYSSCTRHSVAFLCIAWRTQTHTSATFVGSVLFSSGNCTSSVGVHARPLYITQDVLQSHKSVSFYCCSWLEFWFVVDVHPSVANMQKLYCLAPLVFCMVSSAPTIRVSFQPNVTTHWVETTVCNLPKSSCAKSVRTKPQYVVISINCSRSLSNWQLSGVVSNHL